MSSSEYRIAKDRLPVVLTTVSGERITGEIFVQPYAPYRAGREEPQDILNAAEPWFPVACEDGETVLVAKEQVVELEAVLPLDEDPVRHAGMQPSVVELRLVTGELRSGALFIEVPSDRPRILDFLNRVGERFLLLHDREHLRLVNRRFIEYVRPLD